MEKRILMEWGGEPLRIKIDLPVCKCAGAQRTHDPLELVPQLGPILEICPL